MGKGKRRSGDKSGGGKQLALQKHIGQASFTRPNVLRRACNVLNTVSGATGATVSVTAVSSDVLNSNEFQALDGAYQEYRVRAIRLTVVPRYNQQVANGGATAPVVSLPANIAALFTGATTPPGSGALALNSQGRVVKRSTDILEVAVTSAMNPSSLLWQNVSGATTTLSLLGVYAIMSAACPGYYNGTPVWDCFVEFDTEFRTAV